MYASAAKANNETAMKVRIICLRVTEMQGRALDVAMGGLNQNGREPKWLRRIASTRLRGICGDCSFLYASWHDMVEV